jgi:hypothetical protein
MKRVRQLSPIALVVAMTACTAIPQSNSRMPTGAAVGDQWLSPFYVWDSALPQRAGVMLRTEPVALQSKLTAAGLAQCMLYTSTDARWHAGIVPVSGTLYLPQGQPPKGGWPVVAWAHGTLGVADSCAPSWTQHRPRDAAYLNRWLESGFAVVATDYQGLGGPGPHPYLIWQAEGRSILDSVRAALMAHPERMAKEVILTGQSQRSGAALGAARLAPEVRARTQPPRGDRDRRGHQFSARPVSDEGNGIGHRRAVPFHDAALTGRLAAG